MNTRNSQTSVFKNMYSLLDPSLLLDDLSKWPVSLILPDPYEAIKIEALFEHDKSNNSCLTSEGRTGPKRIKTVTACPHPDRRHYAKNMCNNCYHKQGRNKNAWACEHTYLQLYAKGKCQHCYLRQYNKVNSKRRQRRQLLA